MIDGRVRAHILEIAAGGHHICTDKPAVIVWYVIDGVAELAHPVAALRRALRGEVVVPAVGSDMTVRNGSQTDRLSLVELQLAHAKPYATQEARYFSDDDKDARVCLLVSDDGRDQSLRLRGAPDIGVAHLNATQPVIFEPRGAAAALTLAGTIDVDGRDLAAGAMCALTSGETVRLSSRRVGQVLVVDSATRVLDITHTQGAMTQ